MPLGPSRARREPGRTKWFQRLLLQKSAEREVGYRGLDLRFLPAAACSDSICRFIFMLSFSNCLVSVSFYNRTECLRGDLCYGRGDDSSRLIQWRNEKKRRKTHIIKKQYSGIFITFAYIIIKSDNIKYGVVICVLFDLIVKSNSIDYLVILCYSLQLRIKSPHETLYL